MPRLLTAAVLATLCACSHQPARQLPDLGAVTIPAGSMTDEQGRAVTTDDLHGPVTVADFIFTRCRSTCPAVTLRMRAVQDRTRKLGARVRLLSFSVDPDYDTPEVLSAYGAKAGANPARWRFVTGDRTAIFTTIEKGFELPVDPQAAASGDVPNILHSQRFALLDQHGHLRGTYDSSDKAAVDRMLRDIHSLL